MLNQVKLLYFNIGDLKFGLRIEGVQEILEMVEVTSLPDSPDFVAGVINLRGKIIPVINLGKVCNIKSKEEDVTQLCIIVVRIEKLVTGLIVDRVNEVLKIDSMLIETPSEGISLTQFLFGVAKLEEEIVFVLDLNKIFDFQKKALLIKVNREKIKEQKKEKIESTAVVKSVLHQRAINLSETKKISKSKKRLKQILSFSLGEEWYGLRIKFVKEILYFSNITRVPFAPRCVMGVINLRGEIVALIDIRKILDLPKEEELSTKSHIVVVDAYKKMVGFWVNKIGDIVDFLPSGIIPPLSTLEKSKVGFIEGEIEFAKENKLITLLNLENIINYKMG